MLKIKLVFSFALCLLLFTSCDRNEEIFLDEEIPTTNIIDVDGHDFLIRGDIDGEPFEIKHENNVSKNAPINDDLSSSVRPYFGSEFSIKFPGERTSIDIVFGITENGDNKLEDVVKEASYSWFNHSVPSTSVGEAMIKQFTYKEDVMTNSIIPALNPDNYFEITSITPLELDANLEEIYRGRLYKVEGHFAVDMDKWDNSGDIPRLTVDYFSAIFYDNSGQ